MLGDILLPFRRLDLQRRIGRDVFHFDSVIERPADHGVVLVDRVPLDSPFEHRVVVFLNVARPDALQRDLLLVKIRVNPLVYEIKIARIGRDQDRALDRFKPIGQEP